MLWLVGEKKSFIVGLCRGLGLVSSNRWGKHCALLFSLAKPGTAQLISMELHTFALQILAFFAILNVHIFGIIQAVNTLQRTILLFNLELGSAKKSLSCLSIKNLFSPIVILYIWQQSPGEFFLFPRAFL